MRKTIILLVAFAFAVPVALTTTSCESSGYSSSPRPEYGAYGTTDKMKHARKKIVRGGR